MKSVVEPASVDNADKEIWRANLDGSGDEQLVSGLDNPQGIAVDAAGGKMYWGDAGNQEIQRADLDGTNVEDLITSGLDFLQGIDVINETGRMYWADSGNNRIQRADFDGGNVENLVTGLSKPTGIAIIPAPNLEQIHYRFRNDDGNEATASWAAAEDTLLADVEKLKLQRLRFEISNIGSKVASGTTYRLEVSGANPASCGAATYAAVPTAAGSHWQITGSANLTDGAATTNVASGLTDENTTFLAGQVKDTGNETTGISLTTKQFTEIEFAIQATLNSVNNATYCFRLKSSTFGRPARERLRETRPWQGWQGTSRWRSGTVFVRALPRTPIELASAHAVPETICAGSSECCGGNSPLPIENCNPRATARRNLSHLTSLNSGTCTCTATRPALGCGGKSLQ